MARLLESLQGSERGKSAKNICELLAK